MRIHDLLKYHCKPSTMKFKPDDIMKPSRRRRTTETTRKNFLNSLASSSYFNNQKAKFKKDVRESEGDFSSITT